MWYQLEAQLKPLNLGKDFHVSFTKRKSFTQMCFLSPGTAGDSLGYHRGSAFSTKDRDNDSDSGSNCALGAKGAWWYSNCFWCNLNGLYLHGKISYKGVAWYHWKNSWYSMKRSEMKIRPKDF